MKNFCRDVEIILNCTYVGCSYVGWIRCGQKDFAFCQSSNNIILHCHSDTKNVSGQDTDSLKT